MKHRTLLLLPVLVAFTLTTIFIHSCQKDKEELEFDTQTSQDNALAEMTYNDVNSIVNQAMENGPAGLSTYRTALDNSYLLSSCATVTVTPDTVGGGTLTVDFGATNCLCTDNRYRRGIINISFTGAYRDSGTVITTSFTDYYVGKDTAYMYRVGGTKTVTNKGRNTAGNMWFTIQVNGLLTNYNGLNMSWNSSRTREWIAGEGTSGLTQWQDDQYLISGTASGSNFEGINFTAAITTPLLADLSCRWIRSGVFELTPSGKPTRILDYGDGTCNNRATVTVNGTTFDIVLR